MTAIKSFVEGLSFSSHASYIYMRTALAVVTHTCSTYNTYTVVLQRRIVRVNHIKLLPEDFN